jgi:hypothetical protein
VVLTHTHPFFSSPPRKFAIKLLINLPRWYIIKEIFIRPNIKPKKFHPRTACPQNRATSKIKIKTNTNLFHIAAQADNFLKSGFLATGEQAEPVPE